MPLFSHSKQAELFIQSGVEGRLRRLSPTIRSASFSRDVDVADTTAFGSSARSGVVGLPGARLSIEGIYNSEHWSSYSPSHDETSTFFGELMGRSYPGDGWGSDQSLGMGTLVDYYPQGVPGPLYSGRAFVTNFANKGSLTEPYGYTAELLFTGEVTRQYTPTPGDGAATFSDTFNRANGAIGNGWTDAADLYPASFSDTVIVNTSQAQCDPADVVASNPPWTGYMVGHSVCSRSMGDDDGEVSIQWDLTNFNHNGFYGQVTPAFGLDLNANYLELGVAYNYDVGLGSVMYAQNVFKAATIADSLDPGPYYRPLEDSSHYNFPLGVGPDWRAWITFRVRNGRMSAYWNGYRTLANYPVPTWARGRDGWGWHVVNINTPVGVYDPYLDLTPTELYYSQWNAWEWRPYTGSL